MSDDAAASRTEPGVWAAHAASPADTCSLAALSQVEAATLSGPELVDAIVASEKALSLLLGTQMRLLAALAKPFVAGDPMRLAARLARKNQMVDDDSDEMIQFLVPEAAVSLAAAEVAAALRISPVTAGIRVREADTMTTVLAPTLSALEKGALDRGKARIIAEHCAPLNPEHKAAVQELVLPLAGAATSSELRDLTGQAVITVDPDGSDERHRAAAARRDLTMKALPDAMAHLRALLPADGAVKIFQLTDLLATATAGVPGDNRGIGARRVDALVDIADQLLTLGSLNLSHYLGRPLPDHGTPRARAGDGEFGGGNEPSQPSAQSGAGARSGSETDSSATSGNPNANSDNGSTSRRETDRGSTDSRSTDSRTTDSRTTTIRTTDSGTTNGSASDSRPTSTSTADNGATDSSSTDSSTDSTAKDSTPTHADLRPPGETKGRAVPVSEFSGRQRPAVARSSTTSGNGSPCTACGSTGRSDRAMTRQGRRPHLSVTIGLGTLAGFDNLPGKLAGFGAIPPGLARSLAKSAETMTTLLTDPDTGSVAKAGALIYRPRQELRDQIAALLETCQFPSCRQPVWRCDIDHREPFDHRNPALGGQTTTENTGPYCRRHHLFKHHTEWRTRPDPNSSMLIWISPTGHRYVKGRNQATPPDVWISTAATLVAERLDAITTSTEVHDGPVVGGSEVEEVLTTMVLRHEMNRPPAEYDPVVPGPNNSVNQSDSVENGSSEPPPRNAKSWPAIEEPPPPF